MTKSLRIALLGPPGSGKGTQGEILVQRIGIPRISPGDMLRQEVNAGSKMGKRVEAFLDRGALVDDEVIIDIMRKRFDAPDCKRGYLLDGFPRSAGQARALEQLLRERDEKLSAVISFQITQGEVVERIVGRLQCARRGAGYHRRVHPPKNDGICDRCGNPLAQRSDDTEDTIQKRFDVYNRETKPLTEYYRQRGLLYDVDASGTIDEVAKRVASLIETFLERSLSS